ncbi:MAG: DUF1566 domain-containing protein [Rhodoferax sp.]|nr:DUF1566 domain-containing protein [Rhodoferax sp.]
MNHRLILFVWALALSLVTSLAQAVTCSTNMPPASNPDSAYTDNGDGTVTHTPTGLIWKRCVEGQTWSGGTCTGSASSYTWPQALTLASTSSFAGKSDWRLPDYKELSSLVEECRFNPAINDAIFPNTPGSYFWSGSPYAYSSGYAWVVDFGYGYADGSLRYYGYAVRLVRGGQSFDSLGANPQPDLVVSSLTAPATGTAGGQITISATVTNQGTASAAATSLAFYFSTDATITTADASAGAGCAVPALAPGASSTCPGPITVPSSLAPGNYYFGAIADVNGVVSESDEGNNSKAIPIVVSAAVPSEPYPVLKVNVTGSGSGSVIARLNPTGTASGLNCTSTAGVTSGNCSVTLTNGASVTLTATPTTGSRLVGWSGACSGTGLTCDLTMRDTTTATAEFAVSGACDASDVVSITSSAYAVAHGYEAFDVMCANGRYGVVRLPRETYALDTRMQRACAYQQSSCSNTVSKCADPAPTTAALAAVANARTNRLTLLTQPVMNSLAGWICQ